MKEEKQTRFHFTPNQNEDSDESRCLEPPQPVLQRPKLTRPARLARSYSRRDITLALRTATTEQLVRLTRGLHVTHDSRIVLASLMQLHGLMDDQEAWEHSAVEPDNALALGMIRRGGHLALVQAVRNYAHVAPIHTMAFAALSWLCERTTIKASLLTHGALPVVLESLSYHGLQKSDWSVVTEATYFVGHLSTMPKVALQARYRETALWEELIPLLRLAYKQGNSRNHAAAESAVDAFLFCSLEWARHRSPEILCGVWHAGSLRFIVCLLRESIVYWQVAAETSHHNDSSRAVYEERLMTGCRIIIHWANTPGVPGVHRALVEAGALTVAAELVRLFPPGTALRKAANPCLRAMVPSTED